MKKTVIIISLILFIIILICFVGLHLSKKNLSLKMQENKYYEQYLNKEIYGTDVISILNKAINDNEVNSIAKDNKQNYIENSDNSIKVDLVMITNEEKQEITTYKMEAISKVGINQFIANFNTEKFKITKMEYHQKTGKISYIEISQISY